MSNFHHAGAPQAKHVGGSEDSTASFTARRREDGRLPLSNRDRVLYHLLCSDIDQAADWYERAINARDPFALVIAADPLGSDLRQSSRWPKLARMMNMPTHN